MIECQHITSLDDRRIHVDPILPDTRTRTDPESGRKDMSEEHIDKLSLFRPPKSF